MNHIYVGQSNNDITASYSVMTRVETLKQSPVEYNTPTSF